MAVQNYQTLKRYIIYDDCYWLKDSPKLTLVCLLKSVHDLSDATLHLKDLWADEEFVQKGLHIGIIGVELNEENIFIIDKDVGFLVIEPDVLISVTTIVSSMFCERKTVFNERMRQGFDNLATLEGIIGHEMLGRGMCLKPEMRTRRSLQSIAWNVIHNSSIMTKAYGLGINAQELARVANSLIVYVLTFLHDRCDGSLGRRQAWKITRVVDIEDSIWNPTYGLKGKLDATVEIESSAGEKFVAPLEFKVGKMDPTNHVGKPDHVAQVQLYFLLMSERYKSNITNGLLYYLKPDTLVESKYERKFLQPLIVARNRIVTSQKILNGEFINLPRAIMNPRICENCEHRLTCSLLIRTRLVESLDEYRNTTEEYLKKGLNHLSKKELEFLKAWFVVITLETELLEKKSNVKTLWTVPEHEREKTGRCITNMGFNSAMDYHTHGYEGVLVSFSRVSLAPEIDFDKLEIQPQDFVVVSTAKDICLTYAFVESICQPSIILRMERVNSQFTANPDSRTIPLMTIDKVQSSSATNAHFGYLQALMADNHSASRLRKYIILREAPLYPSISADSVLAHGPLKKYRRKQREVIVMAIRTDSYLFVQGMTEDVKLNTIVGLISFLMSMKKTVLLATYSGTALDNILMACFNENLSNFIRIGEPKIRNFALLQRSDKTKVSTVENVDQLTTLFDETPIIGTTLMSLKHEVFRVRKFDYLIADEASQVLTTAMFGAMLITQKHVIIGNPEQHPFHSMSTTKAMNVDDNIFTMLATEKNTVIFPSEPSGKI